MAYHEIVLNVTRGGSIICLKLMPVSKPFAVIKAGDHSNHCV